MTVDAIIFVENKSFKEIDFNNFLLACKKNVLKMAQNGGCFIGSAFSCIDILKIALAMKKSSKTMKSVAV